MACLIDSGEEMVFAFLGQSRLCPMTVNLSANIRHEGTKITKKGKKDSSFSLSQKDVFRYRFTPTVQNCWLIFEGKSTERD